jgi:hypothetical protein
LWTLAYTSLISYYLWILKRGYETTYSSKRLNAALNGQLLWLSLPVVQVLAAWLLLPYSILV